MKKSIIVVLCVLLFLNLSSVLIRRDGSTFDLISYIVRIILYFYVLYQILKKEYPNIIKRQHFFKLCYAIPFMLVFPLFYSVIETGDIRNSVSSIFPTFFLLSDNLFFLYAGYLYSIQRESQLKTFSAIRIFALFSIIGMTFITVYVVATYGNLMVLWSFTKSEGGAYSVFLNAYKNVNPYKFAILIPFLFLKKSKYNLPITVLCIINIIVAGKKGPLLGIAISTIILYLFVWKKKSKIITYGIYVVLMFVFYVEIIDDSVFQTIIYRLDPSQHFNRSADISFYSSGRDHIWRTILDGFNNSNAINMLFGHGSVGAYYYLIAHNEPNNAHNTWLEILFNFGLVGLIVFILYYIELFKICINIIHANYKWKSIALFLVVFSFTSTFYTVTYRAGFAFSGYANLLLSFLYGNFLRVKKMRDRAAKLNMTIEEYRLCLKSLIFKKMY